MCNITFIQGEGINSATEFIKISVTWKPIGTCELVTAALEKQYNEIPPIKEKEEYPIYIFWNINNNDNINTANILHK